ncbi:MAG: FecR domain-containing protein, partial [Parvibaculum sp.]|nr:FecR domain-containing protein [Parvibaculum sp.]
MGQNDFEDDKRKTQYHHPDAITDEALDWFVHLRDEPVVPETLEAFEQWRADDPKRAETYAKIEHLHEMPSLRRAAQKHTSVPGMVSARNSASPARGAFDRRWFGRVAAATAVLVLTIGISQAPELKLWWQADYTTGTGQRATFELPDGSRMMLNTASAVSLDFDGEQRRVTLLKGEAYFDVRPGADPTFIVSAG